nr:hypothetical protein BaRGS_018035 [Batillaria attramentaria]
MITPNIDHLASMSVRFDRAYAQKDAAAIHPVDETGGKLQDTVIADNAIAWMKNHAQHGNQPFFLAVGFHKPHLPWVFPKQYLSLYPLSHIHLAKYRTKPSNIPDYAWSDFGELRGYQDVASLHLTAPEYHIADNEQLKLRQAYSASVSYMDAQLGRVLDALHHNGFTQNTIIVFLGDHGWHLGDSGEWCKHTNFEVAVRIPMMIYVPGVTAGGHHFKFIDALDTNELVEAVDLFPTVTELAGLPVPQTCPVNSLHVPVCTEGTSLVPLLRAVRSRAHGTNYSVEWKVTSDCLSVAKAGPLEY